MNKKDKLVVNLWVIVLVIASIGIYYLSYDSDRYDHIDDDMVHKHFIDRDLCIDNLNYSDI
jgi:hypothetical protein